MPSIWLLLGCSDFFFHGHDSVAEDPVVVTETFVQELLPLVDILFVVDDTTSMSEELDALGQTASGFVAALNGLDLSWQLGVVTMDTTTDDAGVLLGAPWIITPQTPDAASVLTGTLALDTSSLAQEAGFGAAWLALTPPISDEENRGFRRAGASLEIVFFSDGDDDGDSEDVLGADPRGAFLSLLADEASASSEPAVANAIVGDVPSGCSGANGQALPGTELAAAAEATSGIVSSVCDPDFAPIVNEIGTSSAVWPTRFELNASPDPDTVLVEVDGTRLDSGWSLDSDPPAIDFDDAPPAEAEIVVQYEVAS